MNARKMGGLVAVAAMLLATSAMMAVDMMTVPVGDVGNIPDTKIMQDGTTGYGSVSSFYRIGKYEVTNTQYCGFLNAVATTDTYGLYNVNMGSGYSDSGGILQTGSPGEYVYAVRLGHENEPVNYVSWYDALRFANWLNNDQPTGLQDPSTTEDGAYTFSGPTTVGARNPGAGIWLASENEWYKAAFYKGNGNNAGYWSYATQSDSTPARTLPPGDTNSANYNWLLPCSDVGAYSSSVSAYGTFDQSGNVWEWNETIMGVGIRGLRGGSWGCTSGGIGQGLDATSRYAHYYPVDGENWDLGFRVSEVPEPGSGALLLVGVMFLARRRGRRT